MTATLKRVGRHTGEWRTAAWRLLGVVLVLVGLGLVGGASLEGPPVIERVSVVNDAEFDVQLFIAASDDSSLWLRLPTAPHDSEREVEGVIDPGETWTVHARAQDLDGGMWTVDRDDVEADGWRLEVAPEAIRQLRDSGAPATPP